MEAERAAETAAQTAAAAEVKRMEEVKAATRVTTANAAVVAAATTLKQIIRAEEEKAAAATAADEAALAPASAVRENSAPKPILAAADLSIVQRVKALSELLAADLITGEEFSERKKALLDAHGL